MCSPNKNHYGVHFITATCKNTKLWTWNCWKQRMKREKFVGIGLDQNLLVLFIFQAICRYNLFRAFFEQKINSAHKCTHRYSWLLSWLFSSLDLVWDKFNFSVSLWHKVKTKLLSFFIYVYKTYAANQRVYINIKTFQQISSSQQINRCRFLLTVSSN